MKKNSPKRTQRRFKMIKYKCINHLALVTSDMDKTIRFYRDLLGFRLVSGLGKPGYRQYFFELSPDNLLVFFEWSGAEPIPEKDAGRAVKGKIALDHLCIEVEDEDQLWELKDRFDAAEIWTTELIDNGFIYSFFTFDNNGISLEFCCSTKDIDIKRDGRMKDRSPSEITMEGSLPQPDKWPDVKEHTSAEDRRVYNGELKKLFD